MMMRRRRSSKSLLRQKSLSPEEVTHPTDPRPASKPSPEKSPINLVLEPVQLTPPAQDENSTPLRSTKIEKPAVAMPVAKPTVDQSILSPKCDEHVLVVGSGVQLSADVTSCDKVVVEGRFKGNIVTDIFVLSEGGYVEGEVRCADGQVGGEMKAMMIASKSLLIGKKALVSGDLVYKSLQVMSGGRIQGKLTPFTDPEISKDDPTKEAETMKIDAESTPVADRTDTASISSPEKAGDEASQSGEDGEVVQVVQKRLE